eukprot:TRINITY_DN12517_c0_g1_i4.p2 TRINITY_DN12517_c0_g1~~TRINITY_DN12517_c0_g1_i4.p2  ORF type:complete len:129 (-),score=4.77 TRINITY_DN12517_c0_g1_i4:536-922(-)
MVYERQGSTPTGETPKAVVRRLLSAYENKGYHLYIDNWYSSPQLFRDLKGVGIHCCGTIRKNRRGLPNVGAMVAGNIKYLNNAGLVYLAWMVYLLSTLPVNETTVPTRRFDKSLRQMVTRSPVPRWSL